MILDVWENPAVRGQKHQTGHVGDKSKLDVHLVGNIAVQRCNRYGILVVHLFLDVHICLIVLVLLMLIVSLTP